MREPVDTSTCTSPAYQARIGVRAGIARFRFGTVAHEAAIDPDGSLESQAGLQALVGRFSGNAFSGNVSSGRNCTYDLDLRRQPRGSG